MEKILSLNSGFLMIFNNLENFNIIFKSHEFKLENINQYFGCAYIPSQDKIEIYHRHTKYANGYKCYIFTLSDLYPEDIQVLLNLLVEKGHLLE